MLISTAIAGAVAYSMTKLLPLRSTDVSILATLPKFLIIAIVSFVVYIIAGYFLNLSEVEPIIKRVKKWLFKNV